MTFRGKRVLLTGATGAIGSCLAHQLFSLGAELVLVGRSSTALEALARELRGTNAPRPQLLCADLSDSESPGRIHGACSGSIDVLMNNAGIEDMSAIGDAQTADARRQFEVNYWAPLELARHFLPELCRNRGSVVNVSTLAAYAPIPHLGHYSASKAALVQASEIMRLEYPELHVMLVLPGPIRTDMHARMTGSSDAEVVLGKLPTGKSEAMAAAIVKGLQRRRNTVIYPGVLGAARVAPGITAWASRAIYHRWLRRKNSLRLAASK